MFPVFYPEHVGEPARNCKCRAVFEDAPKLRRNAAA